MNTFFYSYPEYIEYHPLFTWVLLYLSKKRGIKIFHNGLLINPILLSADAENEVAITDNLNTLNY